MIRSFTYAAACLMIVGLITPRDVSAHCDTYSGPVIVAAKQALEKGDVTPVLKWVKKDDEEIIKTAFKKSLAVRSKGTEAKELGETYFFETLVRIHRAGEGAPYTGLKDEPAEPIIALSDKAIQTGNIDTLANKIATHLKEGIKQRFTKVTTAQKEADKNVDSGREYVEAYVTYVHYLEGIHSAVMSKGEHHSNKEHD